MSQALLISDDEVLECIYTANLTAYVGLDVTIKHNINDAIKLLEADPNLDLIISLSKLEEKDITDEIINYVSKNNIEIPLMVIGPCEHSSKKAIYIKGNYDLKNIIRNCAKVLDVSAQDMADKNVPEYYPIPIRLIEGMQDSVCDIYYRTQTDQFDYYYTKIIKSNSNVGNTLHIFKDGGANHVYVKANQRLQIINRTSDLIISRLEQNDLSIDEKNDLIEQGFETVSTQLFEKATTASEIAKLSKVCVMAMKDIVQEVPKLKTLIHGLLSNKTKYPYLHTIICSYLASEIIKNISWGSKEQADKVTFVLFFHDIFLTPLFDKYPEAKNEDDLLLGHALEDNEKEQFLNHAKMAGDLVSSFRQVPIGADTIIRQHHGTTSGIGFALDFKDDVSPLSKVIIITEDYVNEILGRRVGNATISFDQKDIIAGLKTKYTRRSYQKIIEALENLSLG